LYITLTGLYLVQCTSSTCVTFHWVITLERIRRLLAFEFTYTYTRTNDLSIKCKYDSYFADITKAKQNIQNK